MIIGHLLATGWFPAKKRPEPTLPEWLDGEADRYAMRGDDRSLFVAQLLFDTANVAQLVATPGQPLTVEDFEDRMEALCEQLK